MKNFNEVRLAPEAEAAGYRLLTLGATDSTNEDALRAARDGDPGQLWIVADEQLKGRGRHGRAWASPPGNLYASLLLIEPCAPADAPQLGFVGGLAFHRAIEAATGMGAPRLALKWPNDLLLDDAKVSGLLLEGHRVEPRAPFAVVVGMGVNVAFAPTDTPYPAMSLSQAAPALTRENLFVALSRAFASTFADWRSQGFACIRQAWLDRAAGLDKPVSLRLPAGEKRGLFRGLDLSGRLQLECEGGLEIIDAGDLYFPASTPTTAKPPSGLQGS